MNPEAKLEQLGLFLPFPATPAASYVRFKRAGDLVFISGHGPRHPDGSYAVGVVGRDITVDEAYLLARAVALDLLAVMREACGTLENVEVLKLLGMVNAVPGFGQQPEVINGCSDLLIAVLGENGKHARSAVGMASLPGNMPIEIEAVVRALS